MSIDIIENYQEVLYWISHSISFGIKPLVKTIKQNTSSRQHHLPIQEKKNQLRRNEVKNDGTLFNFSFFQMRVEKDEFGREQE